MGLIDPLKQFIQDKFGKATLAVISAFLLGIVVMYQFGNYVVTPDALDERLLPVEVRVLLTQLELNGARQDVKETDQFDLEDKIFEQEQSNPPQAVSPRDRGRLEDIRDQLKELREHEQFLLKEIENKTKLQKESR